MESFVERVLMRLGHNREALQVGELERLKKRQQACRVQIGRLGSWSDAARIYTVELAEVTAAIKDLEELLTGENYHVGEGKE